MLINDRWGSVCDYGWNILSAAIACQQMGLVLNPQDWHLESHQLGQAGLEDPVRFTEFYLFFFLPRCHSTFQSILELPWLYLVLQGCYLVFFTCSS